MKRTQTAICLSLLLVAIHSKAQAEMVTWTIDTNQSWIRLTIPDQEIIVGGAPTNAWLRGAPATFDPATPSSPAVAAGWADNAGRLTNPQGTFTTDYVEGSSVAFTFGSDTMTLAEVGSFIPNRTFYNPSPEGFNAHTLPPNGHPAAFAFDLTLAGFVRIAPCAIWGMNFDMDGSINLSGTGPWNQSGGSVVVGGQEGAILDFWAFIITGPDRITLGTTQGPNAGSISITDEGNGVRKMTIPVDCTFTVLISGLPLSNSKFTGQIVATATLTQPAQVVSRAVYHGGFSGSGTPPNNRIDTGKVVAKEGSGPTALGYNNVINTSRGINGLVFDIQDLGNGGALSATDFEVQVSPTGAFDANANPPAGWAAGPAPSAVTVIAGSPDRVLVEWPNNSIMNRWVRVTLKANANTGLTAPETYYLGHLLGETSGLSGSVYTVAFADITPIRSDAGQTVNANSITDIDKTGTVSFADISAMRPNVGAQLSNVTIP